MSWANFGCGGCPWFCYLPRPDIPLISACYRPVDLPVILLSPRAGYLLKPLETNTFAGGCAKPGDSPHSSLLWGRKRRRRRPLGACNFAQLRAPEGICAAPHGRGPYPSNRNRPPGPISPASSRGRSPMWSMTKSACGSSAPRSAGPDRTATASGAGRPRAVEIVPRVADHDDLRRLGLEEARESERHPRIRLSPVTRIVASDEFDMGVDAERLDLAARALLGIVCRDAKPETQRAQRGEDRQRLADRRERLERTRPPKANRSRV